MFDNKFGKNLTSLFNARAIDRAILVLPVPGGPCKHKILPLTFFLSIPIAINS